MSVFIWCLFPTLVSKGFVSKHVISHQGWLDCLQAYTCDLHTQKQSSAHTQTHTCKPRITPKKLQARTKIVSIQKSEELKRI